MQNGPKTIMSARQPRPAASFAARSKRWTSSAARPEPKSSQNAQRNYERCLALARAEAQIGNTVGAENYYQYAETLFQIDARGLRTGVRDVAVMAACRQGAGGDQLSRRRPWLTTRNANRHPNVRVGTTQRSIAAMASAWLRRNVRHVCAGGPRCLIMYLETVDSASSKPSLRSWPWMRGAPHNGLSLLICRMSSHNSRLTLGLPG
jgi:hypothetical protein